MRRKIGLVGIVLSLLAISTTIQWVNSASSEGPTDITLDQIQPVELQRVKYLARAYVYEPQDFRAFEKTYWEYEDFRPFYKSRIEVQIDDYDTSKMRDEVVTEYDIIILTTPRDSLSEHDKSILDKFEASKGIIIPYAKEAYDEISTIRYRFESGQLKSKQDIYIWEYHSASLDVYYPEVAGWFTVENAQRNAAIMEQFYRFARDVVDEAPFHGGKISIAFFKYRHVSMAGQIVRMGVLGEEGNLFPPSWAFYHELAHDFTGYDGPGRMRTSTAGYVNINIAFGEAIANLFAYYFDSTFKYDTRSVREMNSFWKSKLQEYESKKIDPYALNWHGHNEDQRYLEAMLFHISERYSWQTWNYFFRIAKQSHIPQPQHVDMEDLREKDASLALSRFVYLLSLAAGEDLRPQFKTWRFRIEPEVESLNVYRVSLLTVNVPSGSAKVGDDLVIEANLMDVQGNPVGNQIICFYLRPVGGNPRPIGNATTDSSGHAEIVFKIDVWGAYKVVAWYEGTITHGQSEASTPLTVEPPITASTTAASVAKSITGTTSATATFRAPKEWLVAGWPYLGLAAVVAAIAVILLTRKGRRLDK